MTPRFGHSSTILGSRDGYTTFIRGIPVCTSRGEKGGGGECCKNKCVGLCSPLPKILTLFMIKIYDSRYPSYDPKKLLLLKYIPSSRVECENHILQGSTPRGCEIHFFHVGILNFETKFFTPSENKRMQNFLYYLHLSVTPGSVIFW